MKQNIIIFLLSIICGLLAYIAHNVNKKDVNKEYVVFKEKTETQKEPEIKEGGYITIPNPKYPPESLQNEEEGTVKLAVIVDADAVVKDVIIIQSSGSEILDKAAINAAKNALYAPKEINGKPATTRFTTSFTFKLE
nr:energy transducer TonB [uncultured Kingella sp.]